MSLSDIKYCPGTLASNHSTYSRSCLNKVFNKRLVSHILPYGTPANKNINTDQFTDNIKQISIPGVQEKFSLILDKNKLRLVQDGEQGTHILKPIPSFGKNTDQIPANEHLTMQIAKQVFDIETAENALIFFNDGSPAYITKRFDVQSDGSKWAQEDFSSLAGRSPQTHGEHYKYKGSYLELFELIKQHLPTYKIQAIKLFKLIVFNYLFSNGDAHLKNFSIIETSMGDFQLSPAYDLLNSRIHIEDNDFALEDGLLPNKLRSGSILNQFHILANQVGISSKQIERIFKDFNSNQTKIETLISSSFLIDKIKRNYLQSYQTRLKKLK